jgi:hypothetical protein
LKQEAEQGTGADWQNLAIFPSSSPLTLGFTRMADGQAIQF